MLICKYCLEEIISRGELVKGHDVWWDDERIDENNECKCEWCEEYYDATEVLDIEW